jgi:hypothetical protein
MSPAAPGQADAPAIVYDSGVLIAISSGDPLAFRRHQGRLLSGYRIMVPAVVAAQVIRNPVRQARLMRALRGCDIVPFSALHHVPVGRLLAAAGTADVVDAFVALLAAGARAAIVSTDPHDIGHLLSCLGVRLPVFPK